MKYEYVVVTVEFEKCDEKGTLELDNLGQHGYWIASCVTWGKFITWTLCRQVGP